MNPTDTTNTNPGSNTTIPGAEQNTFVKELQNKLLSQSGIVSSTTSNLEQKLTNAMAGIKDSANSSNQALESQYQRENSYAEQIASDTITGGRAAGSGGVLNMAALRHVTETTDKSLKDLKMRKDELILQNNAQAASKVAELEVKTLEMRQNAEQQVFQNLLGLGTFATNIAEQQRADRAQSFQEKSTINNIALQYGVPVKEGDTIETIVNRAAPFASAKQKMELAKTQSEINANNATAAKAMRGDSVSIDSGTISAFASSAYKLSKDPNFNVPGTQAYAQFQNLVAQATKGGQASLAQFTQEMEQLQSEELKAATNTAVISAVQKNPYLSNLLEQSKEQKTANAPKKAAKEAETKAAMSSINKYNIFKR